MEISKMKKSLTRKLISFILALAMVLSTTVMSAYAVAYDPNSGHKDLPVKFLDNKKPDVGFYINAAGKYMLETVPEPMFGTSFGEWSVMDLLRGMYTGSDYVNNIPKDYFEKYIGVIENEMIEKKGRLHSAKYTEYSRLTLPLSSLGYDVHSVAPHYRDADDNVVDKNTAGAKLVSYDIPLMYSVKNSVLYRQGINGPIWVLIAMNTGNYKFYTREQLQAGIDGTDKTIADKLAAFNIRSLEAEGKTINSKTGAKGCKGVSTEGKQIEFILSREIKQADGTLGGWALYGSTPDPDITAMALQGLTPYYLSEARFNEAKKNAYSDNGATTFDYSYKEFKEYVERAIYVLSKMQEKSGGYSSWGSINSESVAQVIVALTGLKMDPMASKIELPTIGKSCSFIKEGEERDGVTTNNLIDNILTFWAYGSGSSAEIGGFKHVTAGADGGGGSGTSVNGMATDQALYALIAYDRFVKGEKPLYDMTDMTKGEYKQMKATKRNLIYDMNGYGDNNKITFSPYETHKIVKVDSTKTHIFNGWNTKSDGKGTSYAEGDVLSMPDKDVTLYAMWTITPDGEKIEKVINEIKAIGKVTLDSEVNIQKARAAYNALDESLKSEISNYSVLEKAEKLLVLLKENKPVLDSVIMQIDSIGKVTLDSEANIQKARAAYNALDESLKLEISNYATLEKAEQTLKDLKKDKDTAKDKATDTDTDTDTAKNTANTPKTGDSGLLIPILLLLLSTGSVVLSSYKLRKNEK